MHQTANLGHAGSAGSVVCGQQCVASSASHLRSMPLLLLVLAQNATQDHASSRVDNASACLLCCVHSATGHFLHRSCISRCGSGLCSLYGADLLQPWPCCIVCISCTAVIRLTVARMQYSGTGIHQVRCNALLCLCCATATNGLLTPRPQAFCW